MRQKPLLRVAPLSNRIYLVTRYRDLGDGMIEALGEKIDVTDQVGGVLEELDRRGLELRPKAKAS